MRVTRAELKRYVQILAKNTGEDFSLDIAYGEPKLVAHNGSRNISARMTTAELYNAVRVAINVIDLIREDNPNELRVIEGDR